VSNELILNKGVERIVLESFSCKCSITDHQNFKRRSILSKKDESSLAILIWLLQCLKQILLKVNAYNITIGFR